MKIYVLTIPIGDCISDEVGMIVVQAHTHAKVSELLRNWNSDHRIRSAGGCPIEMRDIDDYNIQCVGNAFESETEPKILHYTYSR